MTLRTALVVSGDTAQAKRALADLDQAMDRSEQSTAELGREGVKASLAMERLEVAERDAARAGVELSRAQKLAVMHGKEFEATVQRQRARGRENVASIGAQRAGLQQLGYQIGDVSMMYSLGARPATIFATQIGQITQAAQLALGGSSKFATFLTGPWGIAMIVAVQAISPFVGKLWETEDAMEAVELASDGMSEAQSVLEKMFDRTTGAIKEQNEQLRLNAQLMAINLRAEAESKRASADAAFDNFQRGSMGLSIGQKALGAFGIPVGGTVGREMDVRNLLREMQSGRIDRVEAAQRAQDLDFDGLAISRSDFLQAIADDLSSGLLKETADRIESSLANEELDPTFRSDRPSGRDSRSRRSGRSAEEERARLEERYLSELASQQQEELQARLALATNIEDELDIRLDLLAAERAERERQIRNNQDYTAAQKQAQLAHLDLLYGKRAEQTDGQIIVSDQGLLGAAEKERITQREISMGFDMLAMQASALDAQAGVALGLDERFALEKRALDLQQEIERKLLEQDIAQGRILDAAQARALLEERQAAQREGVRLDQRGPLERYTDDLNMGPEEMRRWGEQLVVDELEHLRNGMREGITDALGVDDPFLSGIIDMFIQQVLIAPFAEALQSAGAGDWVSGLFSSVLGIFGGGRAEGGPVSPGKIYAVNERSTAPGLFLPLAPGRIDPAGANDNGSMRGSSAGSSNYFDLRGAVVTQDLLDQMNQIARGEARAAVAGYDQVAASRVQDTLERRQ
ncbi:MAG: hypothetical protein OSA41_05830 [Erythrobacter sp.]|nr:hypothetical protein [Erythrobacter sp.]